MDMRNLFSTSARKMRPVASQSFKADLGLPADNPMVRQLGDPGMLQRAPTMEEDPERRYLGGLVKYNPVEGQTGADRMQIAGAMLQDMAAGFGGRSGGSLARVQESARERQERDRAKALLSEMYPDDPEAELMFAIDPDAITKSWLEERKPAKKRFVEAPDGIYQLDEDTGQSRKVQAYERSAPSGWEWRDGELAPIKGGPYDPEYIGQTAGVRRKAVTANPMPSRARSGGGGGGSSGLPAGFRLKRGG